ncbi:MULTISPECIES: TonB-dependent receptor [Acidobacterium]|uniref:TonB-dependent transporter Oar-like beta-barrel domain-containing protein n=1 Tax=Acidobacterium capsulatum (strain ATCC 51196 / DSM 11244 / BCRC 80197 / JCM 7670 / NBRC 15755 / NCIMB 13165 / 161) TaxID=240015 RepID=C1F157_ACIC5|nr:MULTISPECIES: TonB-dependent receptor [Acidobacterium]ACO33336.1 hypothetical protein ACP_0561 [Acidobacterium capsulatum ATCC 51196]HCT61910.1 carboxypeptidase regulatory-like domain-containing protein [Acidobacterium sp.]
MMNCFQRRKRLGPWTLCLLIAFSFTLLYPNALVAQLGGEGAIQGRVVDQTGAVVPLATVTAIDEATGVQQTRQATRTGDYAISPLPPGEYTVKVVAKGFAILLQEHVTVDATRATGLDLHLKVGTQAQQITVSAAPPALDTTDGTLGETMENKQYASLPLSMNGQQRDPTAFVYLMPGVQGGGRSGTFNGEGSNNGYLDEMYVDGIPLTTISQQGDNRTVSLAVSVDAVNQFQVITSSSPVEFQGLGVQNYVIKSGTNKFHGSVVDYIRNTAFDSWNFFAKGATETTPTGAKVLAPKPAEHQNEFDVSLGGPIRHNKMFFFVSYDKFHFSKFENPGLLTVPTLAERQGDFSDYPQPIYDPTTRAACTAANGGVPCAYQFQGMKNGVMTPNVIPANEISNISKYMEQFLPDPSNSNLSSNYFAHVPTGDNNWEFTGRLDYQVSPRQKISIISNAGVRDFIGLDLGADAVLPLPYSNGIYVKEITATGILEDSYVITPHMVNQLKYGYVRQWGPASNPTLGISKYEAASGVGIGNLPAGQASDTFPNVSFGGGVDAPSEWYSHAGYTQHVNTYTLMDNLQWQRGKNNFTFGADFQWLNENESNFDTQSQPLNLSESNVSTSGYYASGSKAGQIDNADSGSPFASFLIGAVNATGITVQPFSTLGARYKSFSPYAEDDIRLTPKLTVNLGLRWDFYPPYHEVQNRWSFMNPNLINPATDSPGIIEFAGNGPDSCNCKTPVHYYYGNAAPRLGFAYAVNNKTVVRGGFGINYSHGGGVGGRLGANNGTGQVGYVASTTFASTGQGGIPAFYLNSNLGNTAIPAYTLSQDFSPTVQSGNYLDANGNSPTPGGVSYADPIVGGRAPYSENWNIGVQRAITNSLTLSINYSASQSHFLTSSLKGRGYYTNQLDPKYLVLGGLLNEVALANDPKTGKTYLQEAQAILPGIHLPYANFGGPHATIESMLQPFPQYGGITDTWGNISNANYNSLQLTLSQRAWHGLTYTLNYTWSKEIDNAGNFRSGYAIPASAIATGVAWKQDRIDRSLGAGEQPQIFHFFGTYNLPFGQGKIGNSSRAVRWLAGNWALSWIASYGSGTPLEITSSNCTAVGQATCYPDYNPAFSGSARINGGWGHGITHSNAGSISFINAAAFNKAPGINHIGDVSRTAPYNLFGPGGYDIDAGVRRTFPITNHVNFVFDAEAFNVTNTVTFGGINTNVSSSNFGTVSRQTNTSRDWQFSGRLNF